MHIPKFVLLGEALPSVSKCKYLGNIITEELIDNNDISRQYKRIYAQGNALATVCTEAVKYNPIPIHYIPVSCGVLCTFSSIILHGCNVLG